MSKTNEGRYSPDLKIEPPFRVQISSDGSGVRFAVSSKANRHTREHWLLTIDILGDVYK